MLAAEKYCCFHLGSKLVLFSPNKNIVSVCLEINNIF